MPYESNPANGFRDILRKRNTDAQTHIRTARHDDDHTPAPTSWAGDENLSQKLLNYSEIIQITFPTIWRCVGDFFKVLLKFKMARINLNFLVGANFLFLFYHS